MSFSALDWTSSSLHFSVDVSQVTRVFPSISAEWQVNPSLTAASIWAFVLMQVLLMIWPSDSQAFLVPVVANLFSIFGRARLMPI